MKKIRTNVNYIVAISFIAIVGFISCRPNVLFQESLPPGVDSIDRIPRMFQGVYICESDSSKMYADEKAVYNESYYQFITTLERIEETENCSIVAGGLFLPGRKECIPFEYIGEDSITAKVYTIDTLFSFRNDEIMKLYKGHLFMNYKNYLGEWITHMITPMEDRSMKWEIIDVPDKLNTIREITHEFTTRIDGSKATVYIIKPTLVEFDRILSRGYTRSCDILMPLNMEI